MIGVLFIFPVQVFTVSREGTVIDAFIYRDQINFSVQWKHSVEKEIWEEFFSIEGNDITMNSTRFKTFGAGVPSSAGTDTYVKDGWVYMVGINREIGEELAIRTGKDTNYQMKYHNDRLKLDAQTSYHIQTDKVSFSKAIFLMMR
ncbi:protein of unknown function [Salinibacillus kushneri]|uniref:DUF1850 domain-containing protein n=1 Tax=Salinibacillus kushneri TaxID=237682 RepID=A0A1H9YEX3_9BACI|nr:protein of unknown function [Salinibacillus kushneri]